MSRELEIREVRLVGEKGEWAWSFRRGVNVIVGPVGTGKTTLLNLVRFGLGGSWTPTKKARESADRARVALRVDTTELLIERAFGRDRVLVAIDGGEPAPYRLNRRKGHDDETLSDLLLDRLGIPRVSVPSSRAKPGKSKTSISFQDVMTHLYLEQVEIDRSTARSDDKVLRVKRYYVFELLYGLLDERLAALQVAAGERKDETKRLQADRKRLEGWAQRYQTALTSAVAADAARATVERLGVALGEIEQEIAADDAEQAPLREELVRADERVAQLLREQAAAESELQQLRAVQAQLTLDLERIGRAEEATARFQAFEYVICPRCLQGLGLEHPPDHCGLCGQVDVQAPSVVAIASEHDRRADQLRETADLVADTKAALDRLGLELTAASAEHDAVRRRVMEGAGHGRMLLERRTALLVERASAQKEVELARTIPNPAFLVDEVDRELTQVADDQDRIEEESRRHEEQIASRRQELSELSEIFTEILHLLDLPWFEGEAVVDEETYLPLVDGQTLPALSSGGMKATVNLAYYLSNLVFALREPTSLMPRFLMIDGLRKDFGAGAKDLARAEMIYRFLLTQQDVMTGPPPRPFQMLVVDNDLPAGVSSRVNVIELDYETPLISDESEVASE